MIRLEHVNLVVNDIQPTLAFLQTALPQWRVRGQGQQARGSGFRNWLHFGNDDYYLTLNDNGQGENRDLTSDQPGLAHIGLIIDDLDALEQRLSQQGYDIDIVSGEHPFRRSLYYLEPNGFQFEFMQYLSEEATQKNRYD